VATIKATLEAEVSDEVMKKFIEVLEKTEKPLKEIQVQVEDVRGRMVVRVVPAGEEGAEGKGA